MPENAYFVMGDKRDVSIDSRSTLIGSVDEEQIIGKVWLRVYPLGQLGGIPLAVEEGEQVDGA